MLPIMVQIGEYPHAWHAQHKLFLFSQNEILHRKVQTWTSRDKAVQLVMHTVV